MRRTAGSWPLHGKRGELAEIARRHEADHRMDDELRHDGASFEAELLYQHVPQRRRRALAHLHTDGGIHGALIESNT